MTRRSWLEFLPFSAFGFLGKAQSDVHAEIRTLAAEAPLKLRFNGSTAEECRRWQQEFGSKLRQLLGSHQPPARWQTLSQSSVDLGDHRREELILRAPGHRDLPLYLLTPSGQFAGRRPGIVALHGHGPYGHDAVAGIGGTPEREQNLTDLRYDYGRQLARRGFVVVAPCFTPFGRRLGDPKAYGAQDPCATTFVRMQLFGQLLMAENLRDALWSLELLANHDRVDSERIGCVGLSYGGRMTMLTAAISPRVKVAVISGALNLMQERVTGRYSCGAQVIPGLLNYGDVPEISSLIAPRYCLWEIGKQDPLMVKDWLEPALDRIRRSYGALGALDHLAVDFFDGGHRWNGDEAYPMLTRVLRP
jgi:dienelactone hydrolase